MIRTLVTLFVWWVARTAFRLGEWMDRGRAATAPALPSIDVAPSAAPRRASACECVLCGRSGIAAGEMSATCSRCQRRHEGIVCGTCARDGHAAWMRAHPGCALSRWEVGRA